MFFDEVVFFNDTGFMEGGQDVPALPVTGVNNLAITDAQCTSYGTAVEDVAVQKDSVFSEMKVRVKYVGDAFKWTYLRAKGSAFLDANVPGNAVMYYYGWIDSAEIITVHDYTDDSDRYASVRVRWHLDYWRTYGASAVFGRGTVKRALPGVVTAYPPQGFPHTLMLKSSTVYNRGENDVNTIRATYDMTYDLLYALVVYNSSDSDDTTNYLSVLVIPFKASDGSAVTVSFPASGIFSAESGTSMSLEQLFNGYVGSCFGIAPSQIVGAFICTAPLVAWDSVAGDTYTIDTTLYRKVHAVNDDPNVISATYACLDFPLAEFANMKDSGTIYTYVNNTFVETPIGTDDTHEVRIVTPDGETVGTVPHGFKSSKYDVYFDITPTMAYYVIHFKDATTSYELGRTYGSADEANGYGLEWHVPMPTIPIAANSWSEYAFSADRQYDIDSRVAQQEIAYTKNLLGIGTSALSGGVVGGMSGNPVGAVVGSIVGLIGGTAEAVGGKMTDEAWNGTLQNLEDRRAAGQTEGIALPGASTKWWYSGKIYPTIEVWEYDERAKVAAVSSMTMNGVSLDIPTSDCTSYLQVPSGSKYPVQIADLEVTGPIPNAARNYIRGRLAAGVRMVQGTRWS